MKVTGRAHGVMATQTMPETIVPVKAALFFWFYFACSCMFGVAWAVLYFFFFTLGLYFITIHFILRCFADVMRMLTLSLALSTQHNTLQDKNGVLHTTSPVFSFAQEKVVHDIYCQSKFVLLCCPNLLDSLQMQVLKYYLFMPDGFWMLFCHLGDGVWQQVFVEALLCLLFFCMYV